MVKDVCLQLHKDESLGWAKTRLFNGNLNSRSSFSQTSYPKIHSSINQTILIAEHLVIRLYIPFQ